MSLQSLQDSLLSKRANQEDEKGEGGKGTERIFKTLSSDGFKVSEKRWFIILVFCVLTMSNSMMWCTFSPISDVTEDFFEKPLPGNNTAVNMFTVVFYVLYLPGTILGTLVTKKTNLRELILFGGALTALGGLFRCIGVAAITTIGSEWSYALTLFGQILGAVANPFFMNIPASLASTWFAIDQRDLATAITSMCNPFGDVIGQILPPLLVTKRNDVDDDSNAVVDGMLTLMIIEFGWALVGFVLCYFFFDACPPTPPSASTYLRQESKPIKDLDQRGYDEDDEKDNRNLNVHSNLEERNNTRCIVYDDEDNIDIRERNENYDLSLQTQINQNSYNTSYNKLKSECNELFSSREYVLLFIAISIGLGTFNSVLGLLNQIVQEYGYSNWDAGWFGAVLVAAGMLFAGVAGYIMDKTHAYRECLRYCFLLATLSLTFFLTMIYHNNFGLLCFASALLGIFSVGLTPFAIELCSEITYPISEDISVGMLLVGSNYAGILITFVVQELLKESAFGPPPLLPSSIFMISMLGLSVLSVYSFKGEYKRLHADQNN